MRRTLLISAALLGLATAPLLASAQTTATTTSYPSGYSQAQLEAVLPLLTGLNTLQTSSIDAVRGRVVVVGLSAVDRLTLLTRLKAAGLPTGLVDYQTAAQNPQPPTQTSGTTTGTTTGSATGTATGTVTITPNQPTTTPAPTLPTLPAATTLPARGPLLSTAHTTALSGPTSIRPGEASTWGFILSNKGTARLKLDHGACDVRFEVINAAGVIVRPDPKNVVCTMQLILTDIGPGEAQEIQKIRWDGKDARGQNVPAGTYTIRAQFGGAGVTSTPATLRVTVR